MLGSVRGHRPPKGEPFIGDGVLNSALKSLPGMQALMHTLLLVKVD